MLMCILQMKVRDVTSQEQSVVERFVIKVMSLKDFQKHDGVSGVHMAVDVRHRFMKQLRIVNSRGTEFNTGCIFK